MIIGKNLHTVEKFREKQQAFFISNHQQKTSPAQESYVETKLIEKRVWNIEILDLECVLCHVTGVQNENKNALINPPSWIFPRSVVYKMSWGEFNLPL